MGPVVFKKIDLLNCYIRTDFHLFLALIAGPTDKWQPAIGSTFYLFTFYQTKKNKTKESFL